MLENGMSESATSAQFAESSLEQGVGAAAGGGTADAPTVTLCTPPSEHTAAEESEEDSAAGHGCLSMFPVTSFLVREAPGWLQGAWEGIAASIRASLPCGAARSFTAEKAPSDVRICVTTTANVVQIKVPCTEQSVESSPQAPVPKRKRWIPKLLTRIRNSTWAKGVRPRPARPAKLNLKGEVERQAAAAERRARGQEGAACFECGGGLMGASWIMGYDQVHCSQQCLARTEHRVGGDHPAEWDSTACYARLGPVSTASAFAISDSARQGARGIAGSVA